MSPENIAGFTVPQAALEELIDALRETQEDNVVPLHPVTAEPQAA